MWHVQEVFPVNRSARRAAVRAALVVLLALAALFVAQAGAAGTVPSQAAESRPAGSSTPEQEVAGTEQPAPPSRAQRRIGPPAPDHRAETPAPGAAGPCAATGPVLRRPSAHPLRSVVLRC